MRLERPFHGLAVDQTLCVAADREPHRLRIVVRLGDDGQLEHGVQLLETYQ